MHSFGATKYLRSVAISRFLFSVLTVIASFAIAGILMFVTGIDPLEAYVAMLYGIFGSQYGISESIVYSVPLLLIGLGLTFAFTCGVWNIGGDGQFYLGAMGATWVGIALRNYSGIPAALAIPIVLLFGFVAGMLWATIPAVLKVKRGVNEILTTLMMNYIASWLVYWVSIGPLKDPERRVTAATYSIATSAELPILVPPRLHVGILVAIIFLIVTYVIIKRTTLGYAIRAVGANPAAAAYGGTSVPRMIMTAMLLSGGLAGVAGAVEIAGIHHYLTPGISTGYGYFAIAIAMLGGLNPVGVLIASLLFGGVFSGVGYVQRAIGISTMFAYIIQGLVLLFVLLRELVIKR